MAREAKATTGSITHYFEGKDAVLLAALDHVAQGILALIDMPVEPFAGRDELADQACLVLPVDEDGRRDWRVWLAFFSRAVGDPALARINNAYYDEFQRGLMRHIEALQAKGKLRGDIDPLLTANSIITTVDGLGVRASLDPDNWPAERQTQQLRAMLRLLLPIK